MGKTRRDFDVPGNVLASQAAFEEYVFKLGNSALTIERSLGLLYTDENYVRAVRFRAPEINGAEWLAVVTVATEGGPKVAFVGGPDFTSCLRSLAAQLRNGSIRWRDDQYG